MRHKKRILAAFTLAGTAVLATTCHRLDVHRDKLALRKLAHSIALEAPNEKFGAMPVGKGLSLVLGDDLVPVVVRKKANLKDEANCALFDVRLMGSRDMFSGSGIYRNVKICRSPQP